MTWFAHDVKSWSNLQRLFDLFLSRKPYFVVHFITAFISENRPALEEFLEQGFDPETLPFVAFRTPLQCMNTPEFVEKVIMKAIEIDDIIIPSEIIREASQKYNSQPYLPIGSPYNEENSIATNT
jgi:hypothetical protein